MDAYDLWYITNIGRQPQPNDKALIKHLELYIDGKTAGNQDIFHGLMLDCCINMAAELAIRLSTRREDPHYVFKGAAAVVGISMITNLVKLDLQNLSEVLMLEGYQSDSTGPELVTLLKIVVQHKFAWNELRTTVIDSTTRMATFLGLSDELVDHDESTILTVLDSCLKQYYEIRKSHVPEWAREWYRKSKDRDVDTE